MAAPTGTGSINSITVAPTSITITYSSIPGATSYDIAYRPTSTQSATIESTAGTSYTINGLSPMIKYVVNYRGKNSDGVGPFMSSGTIKTTRPAYFTWMSNYLSYEMPNQSPLSSGMKILDYITAKRWENLTIDINYLESYKGKPISLLDIPVRNERITASIYNQCLLALSKIYNSSSYDYNTYKVYNGDTITATHMNRLMNWANYIN